MYKTIAAAVLAVSLAGCASSGVRVNEQHLNSLEPGKSTLAETVSLLGAPTTRIRNADGTTTIMYVYAEAQTKAATFIPIVGLFAGGVDTNTSSVMLQFDKDGILTTQTTSDSAMGTAMGVAAQPSASQSPAEVKNAQ